MCPMVLKTWNKHVTTRDSCFMNSCIRMLVFHEFAMDFLYLKMDSCSLTCSVCALTAIIFQFVAMECGKVSKFGLQIPSP